MLFLKPINLEEIDRARARRGFGFDASMKQCEVTLNLIEE